MQVIRRFNNNIVLCLDKKGNEVIAFGKGLGFHEIPYELNDLKKIEKTYYNIENRYMGMISAISETSLQIASEVVDMARKKIHSVINPNLVITLADHIDFCIERYRKKYIIQAPLFYDFEQFHPTEFELAKKTLGIIKSRYRIRLPESEIVGIGLNILNAELDGDLNNEKEDWNKYIEEITQIIEKEYGFCVDRNSGEYARYISHMQYLMKRIKEDTLGGDDFIQLYETMKMDSPKGSKCADEINDYIVRKFQRKLSREELLYLNIHITRLCSREECYRKGITPGK